MVDFANQPITDMMVMIDLRDLYPPRNRMTYFRGSTGWLQQEKHCRIMEVKVNNTNLTDLLPQEIHLHWHFMDNPFKKKPLFERLMTRFGLRYPSTWATFGISKHDSYPYLMLDFFLAHYDLINKFDTCIIHGSEITGGEGRIHRQPLSFQEFVKGPYAITPSMVSFFTVYGDDDKKGGPRKAKPTIESVMETYQPHSMVLN